MTDIFYTEIARTGRWRHAERRSWFGRRTLVRQIEVQATAHENLGNQVVVRDATIWRDATIQDDVYGPDVPMPKTPLPGSRPSAISRLVTAFRG